MLATERIAVPYALLDSDGNPLNPTALTVSLSFTEDQDWPDALTTWFTGSWATTEDGFEAGVAVGPGGATSLALGRYGIFVKVLNGSNEDIQPGGPLVIE